MSKNQKEINLSLKETDIGILYIVQHEMLKVSNVEFSGVIMKHPLTGECWMRVNVKQSPPLTEIISAIDKAIGTTKDLKKLFTSKIKAK
ncbi:MAG: hypothetical protein K8823_104 [Cenarchaeum symbiont of Oopsacas minuta]|nr:hypothetical protein [Cenarchaeum symbiont of Oopsacas minuta]